MMEVLFSLLLACSAAVALFVAGQSLARGIAYARRMLPETDQLARELHLAFRGGALKAVVRPRAGCRAAA